MSNKNILNILILCSVFAFSVGIAGAEPPPNIPMGLYGNVNIGSSSAPVDTIIVAKVGTDIMASTKVVNPGTYGDKGNYLGIYAPTEGANVDIYVNDVKIGTVAYIPGKSTQIDLNAPETASASGGTSSGTSGVSGGASGGASGGTSGGSSGGSSNGVGGGGVSGVGGTQTVAAIQQQPVSPDKPVSETPAKGNPVTPNLPQFKFSMILGVLGLLAGAIIILTLKKRGKI